ncbi:MAG TPA: hypothetical protein VK154_18455 [Chitinophagales bacterium]|nr:hypothetical protein [Chitinophagales bacterium]
MKGPKIPELLEKINRAAANAEISQLSKLEYDLLMQNVRDLYEALDAARNETQPKTETVVAPVKKRLLNPNEGMLINEPVVKVEPAIKKEPEIKAAPVVETVTETKPIAEAIVVKKEEAIVQQKVTPEVKPKENTLRNTINELVQTGSSLNEKLKVGTNEVHRKLSSRALKDMIDLNKRFVLLNDLFKGNSEALSSSISYIDSLDNFTTAETFFKTELTGKYNWDENSQAVRMFMKLVKQKFGEE